MFVKKFNDYGIQCLDMRKMFYFAFVLFMFFVSENVYADIDTSEVEVVSEDYEDEHPNKPNKDIESQSNDRNASQ